jgi:hypothetical protein
MHFHWQNLNDDKTRPHWGGGARHGRAWWYLYDRNTTHRRAGTTVSLCWSFFLRESGALQVQVQRGDGVGVLFHLGIPYVISLFVGFHGGWWQRLAERLLPNQVRDRHNGQFRTDYSDRELSVRLFDWAIWWNFWTDPDSWSSKTPKYRNGNWHPLDTFLGRMSVTDKEIAREDVQIPMPERSYVATVVLEDRTWRRPRWPFPIHHHIGAHVHMERDPVPHPGKGESEYDCGEDAAYSSSFQVPAERFSDAVSYAVGHVVASSLDSRRRYGGRDWRPREDHRPKSPPELRVAK